MELNMREYEGEKIRRTTLAFADYLYRELSKSGGISKAKPELAEHLGVEVSEINAWLKGKKLPCQELFRRVLVFFSGDNKTNAGTSMHDARDLIAEVERQMLLSEIQLTRV